MPRYRCISKHFGAQLDAWVQYEPELARISFEDFKEACHSELELTLGDMEWTILESSKGRKADSDPANGGSNPSSRAYKNPYEILYDNRLDHRLDSQ